MASRDYVSNDYEFIKQKMEALKERTYTGKQAVEVEEEAGTEDFHCFKHQGVYFYKPVSARAKAYMAPRYSCNKAGYYYFDKLMLDEFSANAGATPEFTKESVSSSDRDREYP